MAEEKKSTKKTTTVRRKKATQNPDTQLAVVSMKFKGDSAIDKVKAKMSPSELQTCEELGSSLQVMDANCISNYGCQLERVMEFSSDQMLEHVRTSNIDEEIGGYITQLIQDLNIINLDDEEKSAIKSFLISLPIVGKWIEGRFKAADTALIQYDSVKDNVDKIKKKISATRLIALKDNSTLQELINNNIEYFNQLGLLIVAAKERLEAVREEYQEKINNDDMTSYEKRRYDAFINGLDKKIYDLIVVQDLIGQNVDQIAIIQEGNTQLAEKAQQIVTLTINLMKNNLVSTVALENQRKSADAQKAVVDMTNTLIQKSAEKLHSNSIAIAQENERPVIDVETLRKTKQLLIDTIEQVNEVHKRGAETRQKAAAEIEQIQIDFNARINEMLPASSLGANSGIKPKLINPSKLNDQAEDTDYEDLESLSK